MGFKLKAGDGTNIPIPDGEYYFNTKARGRRMMANSLSSDARRVYACLELATMGFQQELAVTMERGEQRPLTPTDIGQQAGLSRQNVRRGLEELEDAGLASRKAPDGGALRKGQVLIYSWAVPRAPKKEDCSRARLQLPDWFPDSWEALKPLISRYKYSLIEDAELARDYIEAGAAAARVYKEAEIVATRILEQVSARTKGARASLYVERTERTDERTTTTAQSLSPEEDVVVVAEKLGVKNIAARKFLAACRKASPGCTAEDIGSVIDQVDKTIDRTQIRNPTGILLENVPLKIAAAKKLNDERRAANTIICWACHMPIYPEDARIRGAHQKCFDEEERRELARGAGHD